MKILINEFLGLVTDYLIDPFVLMLNFFNNWDNINIFLINTWHWNNVLSLFTSMIIAIILFFIPIIITIFILKIIINIIYWLIQKLTP